MIALAAGLDAEALRDAFAEHGRVAIPDFLGGADAALLRDHLRRRDDWSQVLNAGDKVYDLDRATRDALSPEQRSALDRAVHAGARHGFQYRYEAIRVPDDDDARRAAGGPLCDFARFLSSGPARDLLRVITGRADIAFADAQATAYAPGDFLTEHDDAVAGKHRRAAYVFGLTPGWRAEWGGLLMFHTQAGRVEGWVPAFNTLSLFSVPQPHSASAVTQAAPSRRYSITGWLRAAPPLR